MGNVVSQQLTLFLLSILLGSSLGLLYDLARALRTLGGRWWGATVDAAYCITAAAALFFFIMAGDGELRLFILLGALGGAVLHFCLLSPLLRPLLAFWLDIFLLPLACLGKFLKKCEQICKKLFSFWRKWFTIILTHRRPRLPAKQGGRQVHGQGTKKTPQQ